ncbi:MAG: S-layer homology domain-containing protein [Oscillospiraceae bacterium]|nr:S-layer homology domain-containing protein [Oscillospiraceae bacterium]
MRRKMMRSAATLLVLALIVSIVPTFSVVVAIDAEPIVLKFNSSTIIDCSLGKRIGNWTVASDAGWLIHNSSLSGPNTPRSVDSTSLSYSPYCACANDPAKGWLDCSGNSNVKMMQFVIVVKDVKEGWYDITFDGGAGYQNAGAMYIYANNAHYAGYYNCDNDSRDWSRVKNLNKLYLKPEADYDGDGGVDDILVKFAKVTGTTGTDADGYSVSTQALMFESLTLTPEDAPQERKIAIAADGTIIDENASVTATIGETYDLKINALLDGKALHYSGYTSGRAKDTSSLSVEVIEGNSVTFEESRDNYTDEVLNGTLKAQTLGTTKLKLTATFSDGQMITRDVIVEVKDIPKLSKADVALGKNAIFAGRTTKAELVLTREDNKAYTDSYSVEWKSSDTSVATVVDGEISGIKKGSATITATVTAKDGTIVYGKADITVKEPSKEPIKLEFNSNTITDCASGKRIDSWIVAENSGWSIAKTYNNTITTIPRALDNSSLTLQLYLDSTTDPADGFLSMPSSSRKQMWFSIYAHDVAEGWYNIEFDGGGGYADAGAMFIYVNGQYAGFYNHSTKRAETVGYTDVKRLNTLYLTPDNDDKVKIVFAKVTGDSVTENDAKITTRVLKFKSLTLTPADEPRELGVEIKDEQNEPIGESITIPCGDTLKFSVSAVLDGNSFNYSGYKEDASEDTGVISAVSDSDVITITEDNGKITDETFNAMLKADKEGTSTIIVAVNVAGKSVTKNIDVEVVQTPKLEKVEVSFNKSPIYATRTAIASVALTRADKKPYILPYTVTYTSSDDKIATVTNDGVITGIAKGRAKITASVTTKDGENVGVIGEKEITVLAKPYLSEVTAKAERHGLLPEETTEIFVSGIMNDGLDADMDNYTLTYVSQNPEIATVDDAGKVTAISHGTVDITVTAADAEDNEVKGTVRIEVSDRLIYTFTSETLDGNYNRLKAPQSWIVMADNWSLVPDKTTTSSTNSTAAQFLSVQMRGASGWQDMTGSSNKRLMQFVVSAKVKEEGWYKVGLCGYKAYYGGSMFIFADGQYAGFYDFHDPGSGMLGEYTEMNTLYLTPDENGRVEIMFAKAEGLTNSAGEQTTNINPSYLTLRPVEGKGEFKELIISKLPSLLAVGEIYTGGAGALLTDGTPYNFGFNTSGGEDSENKVLVELSGEAKLETVLPYTMAETGMNSFTIRGTASGFATLRLGVKMGDMTVYADEGGVKIEIVDDPIKTTGLRTEPADVCMGENAKLYSVNTLESGRMLTPGSETSTFKSLNPEIATVSGNVLTPVSEGTAIIKVTTVFNKKTVEAEIPVEVVSDKLKSINVTVGGSKYIRYTGDKADTAPLKITATSTLNRELDLSEAKITARAIDPEYADVDEKLNVIPVAVDNPKTTENEEYATARFEVTVELDGRTSTVTPEFTVVIGKSKPTLYTFEKRDIIAENAAKYKWAKDTVDSAKEAADEFVDKLDALYEMIHSEGIPRNYDAAGIDTDPNNVICRYCRTDLMGEYGNYPFVYNPFTRPWKVQCPDCKRLFPSNDFESFYKLGLNEYGEFDRMRALEAHRKMLLEKGKIDADITSPGKEYSDEWFAYYGYGVKDGYLYNELYEDLDEVKNLKNPEEPFLRDGETTARWAVDDGFGYVPTKPDGTPYMISSVKLDSTAVNVPERHPYIAAYLHNALWYEGGGKGETGVVIDAISTLADAYYYTGDVKYGRPAAILIDRLADYYKDFDLNKYDFPTWKSGDRCQGGLLNYIWECSLVDVVIQSYDKVFDVYDDPYIIDYLKEKEKTVSFRYSKENGDQIRTNIEDNIVRRVLNALDDPYASIGGNWGMPQHTCATAAVVLDTMPDTSTWLDWLWKPGWKACNNSKGGAIDETLIDIIDHDGYSNEASRYQANWFGLLYSVATVLEDYDRYKAADLYSNAKFKKMFEHSIQLMLTGYTPQIGDSDYPLAKLNWATGFQANAGWRKYKEPIYAQLVYFFNGNSSEGLKYGIDTKDPESLEDEIQSVVNKYGTFKLSSNMLTGFGFAALRSGQDYSEAITSGSYENRHELWMYFGRNGGHGHKDSLNLGMTAYGYNFMPELGYPEKTGSDPKTLQWNNSTLSHNTVMVNEVEQSGNDARSQSYHFDDSGMVKLVDVDSSMAYPDIVDTYRRSVVTIKASDEISYTVDFFRVLGGDDHLYSFHATSDEIAETAGLDFTTIRDSAGNYVTGSQVDENGNYKGTYAGIDIPYGPDPNSPLVSSYKTVYPRGYTWCDNVDRDSSPKEKVEIDFIIKDFNKTLRDSSGLRLRMTLLDEENRNAKTKASVSIVNGYTPNKSNSKNMDEFKYVFVKHSGEGLDTTFTTVFEPYRHNRYLKASDSLPMTVVSGKPAQDAAARAVRVEHTNGRVDYVLYSTDNSVTYKITLDDGTELHFRGFVGVYTMQNGVNTYKYLNDGDVLEVVAEGDTAVGTGTFAAIEGKVKSFTETLEFENEIVITPGRTIDTNELSNLTGKYVYIDNGKENRNGSYRIENAYLRGDDVVCELGNTTVIRQYINSKVPDDGYVFNIETKQKARIPLVYVEDNKPEFKGDYEGITTSAGSSVKVNITAESPLKEGITYSSVLLPRGASLNSLTGELAWKPDNSQVGEHHIAVNAADTSGRESTLHFYITVYGSTMAKPSDTTENAETPSTNGSGASGGGGGGGGGTAPDNGELSTDDDVGIGESDDLQGTTDENGGNSPDASGETDTIRFTDISNHAWAADAINALADNGVIKGTTHNTYSPASNITRADFALLLVRAFNLSSDNTENFADVAASDYFAPELAIARNTGIVNGIGDNKYAPRNTITRQDMMVIVYRALNSLPLEGKVAPQATDEVLSQYQDFTTVAEYARDAVSALIGAGLVNGKNGNVSPKDYTTRAEIAVLLQRILKFIER